MLNTCELVNCTTASKEQGTLKTTKSYCGMDRFLVHLYEIAFCARTDRQRYVVSQIEFPVTNQSR